MTRLGEAGDASLLEVAREDLDDASRLATVDDDVSRLAAANSDASPGSARPVCDWCGGVVPRWKRRDSRFCGKACRQASWRFGVRRCDQVATGRPMRFAYADPPYPGKAGYYVERQEVDHASLVDRLQRDFPDGWALSTSSEALRDVWALCPEARLCVWVRATRSTRSRRALSSWEALLVAGGRPLPVADAGGRPVVQDLRDSLVYGGRYRAFPGALVGMKPPQFAVWMFRLLGAQPGDELDDLFPGSGAVAEAWLRYVAAAGATGGLTWAHASTAGRTRPDSP